MAELQHRDGRGRKERRSRVRLVTGSAGVGDYAKSGGEGRKIKRKGSAICSEMWRPRTPSRRATTGRLTPVERRVAAGPYRKPFLLLRSLLSPSCASGDLCSRSLPGGFFNRLSLHALPSLFSPLRAPQGVGFRAPLTLSSAIGAVFFLSSPPVPPFSPGLAHLRLLSPVPLLSFGTAGTLNKRR